MYIKTIYEFFEEYRFLSNFHMIPIQIDNIWYPSTEHAYQAMKSFDEQEKIIISKLEKPSEAKKYGMTIKLRQDREEVKIDYMYQINKLKYLDSTLSEMLLSTDNAILEEGNYWGDKFWGISPSASNNGKNMLGRILMNIRSELKVKSFKKYHVIG